jgi:hypothetical protein
MSGPRIRSTVPTRTTEVLNVDYTAVMQQAIENERWRVLREVRRAMERIKTNEPDGYNTYRTRDRSADNFKSDVIAALDAIEQTRHDLIP